MKVQNEQLQALQALQRQNEPHRKEKIADGFDALFSEQLEAGKNAQATGSPVAQSNQPLLTGSLGLLLQASEQLAYGKTENEEGANDLDMAAVKVGGLLDQWETYAGKLAQAGNNANPDLKSVYSLLQNMGSELKGLRQSMPDLAERNGNLDSLLNELEVLTTTENFKFNRGDYL